MLLRLIEDSQSSNEERSSSLAKLQAKGIGVLPAIKSFLSYSKLHDNTRSELLAIATSLTFTPRRLIIDSQSLKSLEKTPTLPVLMVRSVRAFKTHIQQKLQNTYLSANEIANVMVDFSKAVLPGHCVGLHIRGDRSTDLEGLLLDANLIFGDMTESELLSRRNFVVGWEVSIFVSIGKKIIERTLKSTLGGLTVHCFSHLATGFREVQSQILEEPFTFSVSMKRFYSEVPLLGSSSN